MGTRPISELNQRALQKTGTGSYTITVPKHLVKAMRWQVRQELVFVKKGDNLILKDAE
ncbi:TPA: AbrB/MazE/SpoVT family DNA-binding domain-containing protein [Candidatus Saccharibacteria bacterium]|nr:AbrB/MazE/SpoVT family DNA-binding domain-containing protein [Candidatus Saccharibacteria bacterium]HIO87181.1 AbrB/MazE/SpoVT family DNA-binding domain-containing protein [Candidatus Saccharibacteria bacterium]